MSEKILKLLENVSDISKKYNLPENAQKPCISTLLKQDTPRGLRDETAYIIACDLINRQNKSPEEVRIILLSWRRGLSDVSDFPESQVLSKIKSASKKKKNRNTGELTGLTYGCKGHNQIIKQTCVGMSDCYFYQKYCVPKENSSFIKQDINQLFELGWQAILTGGELKLYIAIWRQERIKAISPGCLFVITHRELSKESGLCRQSVANYLINLHINRSLIEYRKGLQHRFHNTASEIRRIIPIPTPEENS